MSLLDPDAAMFTKLSTTAGVLGIVAARIYPLDMPPSVTLPCITYQIIDAPLVTTHDETAGSGLAQARHQVDAWASTYAGAVALAKAIHLALHGYHGIVTSGADSLNIQECLRLAKRPNKDAETGLYWISQDYMMSYQE